MASLLTVWFELSKHAFSRRVVEQVKLLELVHAPGVSEAEHGVICVR